MIPRAFAAIYTDELTGAAAALVAFTGLFGGSAHYGSILMGRSKPKVERATGLGFFTGFVLGIVLLLLDTAT